MSLLSKIVRLAMLWIVAMSLNGQHQVYAQVSFPAHPQTPREILGELVNLPGDDNIFLNHNTVANQEPSRGPG